MNALHPLHALDCAGPSSRPAEAAMAPTRHFTSCLQGHDGGARAADEAAAQQLEELARLSRQAHADAWTEIAERARSQGQPAMAKPLA